MTTKKSQPKTTKKTTKSTKALKPAPKPAPKPTPAPKSVTPTEQYKKLKPTTIIIAILIAIIVFGIGFFINDGSIKITTQAGGKLPVPEQADGIRGEEFGIDKNINESTIDKYLGRTDSVYRDMRMLEDPANYEAIGGDSYLSGFVRGFEVVSYPYLVNAIGLPEAVGKSYDGTTLFALDDNGNYIANYEESMTILEGLFPKDKNIFLMCGGGGYADATRSMLVMLGWDINKIYNVGGYWNYEGENNVAVKREENGKTVYDFWKVPYHDINFKELTKK